MRESVRERVTAVVTCIFYRDKDQRPSARELLEDPFVNTQHPQGHYTVCVVSVYYCTNVVCTDSGGHVVCVRRSGYVVCIGRGGYVVCIGRVVYLRRGIEIWEVYEGCT